MIFPLILLNSHRVEECSNFNLQVLIRYVFLWRAKLYAQWIYLFRNSK